MTETIQESQLDIIEAVVPYEDTDDGNEHLTHIVNPTMNPDFNISAETTGQDVVDMARMTHSEVVALCGYKWVPVRNPEKYPVCQTCFDIAGLIMREEG